jgi:hypothetical protein
MDNSANEWREDEVKKVIEEFKKKISSCSLTETDICCGIEQLSILHVEEWLRTTLQNLLDQHTAHLVNRIEALKVEPIPELEGSDGHEWEKKLEEVLISSSGLPYGITIGFNQDVLGQRQGFEKYGGDELREKLKDFIQKTLDQHSAQLVERIEKDMVERETGSHHYTDFEYGMLRAIDIVKDNK